LTSVPSRCGLLLGTIPLPSSATTAAALEQQTVSFADTLTVS
jgi:hypothetical protein